MLGPGSMKDAVTYELAMELVEMLVPGAGYKATALALGVSTGSITRYKRLGRVPRCLCEDLYDRIAYGCGPRKPRVSELWAWPRDYDERADLARRYYREAS